MSCSHEAFDLPPEHGRVCEEDQMGSALGRQRAMRWQVDAGADRYRVAIQPPSSPARLIISHKAVYDALALFLALPLFLMPACPGSCPHNEGS